MKSKSIAICIGIAALLVVLRGFIPETYAFGSRLRHGSFLVYRDVRFKIPMTYANLDDNDGVANSRGWVRTKLQGPSLGMMLLSTEFRNFSANEREQRLNHFLSIAQNHLMENLRGKRTITLAGRTGTCFEFTDKSAGRFIRINCQMDSPGVVPSFVGTTDRVDDFYHFIDEAVTFERTS